MSKNENAKLMRETNDRYTSSKPGLHKSQRNGLLFGLLNIGIELSRPTAGELNARFVIHAVGPMWHGDNEDAMLLRSAYETCLKLAADNDCVSIAFPAISTGVNGYPIDQAAEIALSASMKFVAENSELTLVRFVLFNDEAYDVFATTLRKLQGD